MKTSLAEQYLVGSNYIETSGRFLFGLTQESGMKTVTVKRDELLKIVYKNRESHQKVFAEAMDGYRKEAIEALDRDDRRR